MDSPQRAIDRLCSIKGKLLVTVALALVAVSLTLTVISVKYIRSSTTAALERSISETVKIAASRVSDYLSMKQSLVASIAARVGPLYGDEYIKADFATIDIAPFEGIMADLSKAYGFSHMFVIGADGLTRTARHSDVAELGAEYYEDIAVNRRDMYMSDVTQDQGAVGGYVINIAAPIYDDDGAYIGILVCKIDALTLSTLVADIRVGEYGSTFIMDDTGKCIAHANKSMLFNGEAYTDMRDNADYASLNALWNTMRDESSGFMKYELEGERIAAFDTISGTNNWAIAVTVDEDEFMQDSDKATCTAMIVALSLLLIVFAVCLAIISPITRRITRVTNRLERLAHGDLTDDISAGSGRDEVTRLIGVTRSLIREQHAMIDTISDTLSAMAAGNLNANLTGEFPGDYGQLKRSVEQNIEKLGNIVHQISLTSEEVSRGSMQIADGATSLAQGAAEQASSIEELYTMVSELAAHAKEISNPDNRYLSDDGDDAANDAAEDARIEAAPTLMDKLLTAMNSISQRLTEVRRMSAAIESISSETGMLALNASVEASHAGEYGKGFAVIASEIRELSEKSRREARSADVQIDTITRAMERGNRVMDFTVESVSSMSAALVQVNDALAQVSGVIEGTAATAEESAAGSEELSAQASILKEMVATFTFTDEGEETNEGEETVLSFRKKKEPKKTS